MPPQLDLLGFAAIGWWEMAYWQAGAGCNRLEQEALDQLVLRIEE